MTDKTILTIATFTAKPGKSEELYQVLQRCIAPTRAEDGNVHYDLYRSVEDQHQFLFHETWKNAAAIAFHSKQPHFLALLAGVENLLTEAPSITQI